MTLYENSNILHPMVEAIRNRDFESKLRSNTLIVSAYNVASRNTDTNVQRTNKQK